MQKALRKIASTSFALLFALGTESPLPAADTKYPSMAPVEAYLMERSAEVALARTAAPDSISQNATVMVMGRHGYENAATGKNGFVCIVERSWTAEIDNPDFWNPKLRAPICFNAAAVRSFLPQTIKRTEWVLAGRSKAQMFEDLKAALDKKELPKPEVGAMCYMMSKQGYLNDSVGHWHPHLMFFLPPADPTTWGANLPGSPVIGQDDAQSQLTVLMIPVGHWSDGTAAQ
jgi:hypothetical protein